MYLSNLSRIDLLRLLPGGGEAAEIGVAEGDYSKHILNAASPRKLHLIDPWEHQARADYKNDAYGNVSEVEQEDRFQKVSARFKPEIDAGQVVLHRTYSTTAAPTFADQQFDWVFVDGLHSREGVSADLAAFKNKVKPNGFILGHDYTNHAPAMQSGFGVVEAVHDFVAEHGYHFLVMTMENFPTYVLTPSRNSEEAMVFVQRLLYHASWVVELRDYPQNARYQHHAIVVGGKQLVYPSF